SSIDHYANGPTGLPAITSPDLTIQGNGALLERSHAPGTPDFRLLDVGTGARLVLEDLILSGGQLIGAKGGSSQEGGSGVSGHQPGANGEAGGDGGNGGPGGDVQGGAIFSNGADLILIHCAVTGNVVEGGAGGAGGWGGSGSDGFGVALF